MNGLTNYITDQSWEDTITRWYVLIDDAAQQILARSARPLRASGPPPTFTDSEVITVALIIESFFQGHEDVGYTFVRQYLRPLFPRLLDLDRFNARRRDLLGLIEAIRRALRDQIIDHSDPIRLVDSAPVTLMTYTRGDACRSVAGKAHFGVVTSKKGTFFGWRLHTTVTGDQIIDDWMVAPAAVPDPQAMEALVADRRNLTLIGDKIYNDAGLEERLWRKKRILLLPLRKDNQKTQWAAGVQQTLGRLRHRVETVFSTLTTVFNVGRPRGRSLAGHLVRIATCVLAHTLSFFMP
jgi:hypothetical protein